MECAFVKSDVTEAAYFANPLRLGKEGVVENLGMGQLSNFEKKKLEEVILSISTCLTKLQLCQMCITHASRHTLPESELERLWNCKYTSALEPQPVRVVSGALDSAKCCGIHLSSGHAIAAPSLSLK